MIIKKRLLNAMSGASLLALLVAPVCALADVIIDNTNQTVPGDYASPWNVSGNLYVGNAGNASLTITSGANVTSPGTFIGYQAGSNGVINLSGAGTTWNNAYEIHVGYSGTGSLNITDGASVTGGNAGIAIGSQAGSSGSVTVSGPTTQWIANTGSNIVSIGYAGNGTILVEDGAHVTMGQMWIGRNAGVTGAATFKGSGTVITVNAQSYVGSFGNGSLELSDGAIINGYRAQIGTEASSTGVATITGTGTQWNLSDYLNVGNSGNGTLKITDGAKMSNVAGNVGYIAGGIGNVTVSGAGSQWTNTGSLTVGYNGTGTVEITDGGVVSNGFGFVGGTATGKGNVTVSDAGSQWNNSGALYVGYVAGVGTLNINNGGTVSNTDATLGLIAGSTGNVAVSGAGSQWVNSATLTVGSSGNGTLAITDSGKVLNTSGTVAAATGSIGAVTVSGSGSQWENSGALQVGSSGTGTLAITDGGHVSSTNGSIATYSDSNGAVSVDGSGSKWVNSGSLVIGQNGIGVLTLANGGTASAGYGYAIIAPGASSSGTLNIGAAAGNAPVAPGTLDVTNLYFGFGSGNATILFNHTATDADDYQFAPSISGIGKVNAFSGTTTLTGINDYIGTTTVTGATLKAGAAEAFSENSDFVVGSGGVLDVNGISQTVASLANAGVVRMSSAGAVGTTLTVTGDYIGNNGNLFLRTVLGDDASVTDQLIVNGSATGNTLVNVTNAGGAGAMTTGDGIMVIQAASSTPTAFALAGRVAAGAYDYLLFHGGVDNSADNQNWYLRSTYNPEPVPTNCEFTDSCIPQQPVPIIRDEVAVSMAIPPLAIEYGYSMLGTLHERIGDSRIQNAGSVTEERTVYCKDASQNFKCVVRVPVAKDETRWASSGWARLMGDRGLHQPDNFMARGPNYDYTFGGLQAGLDLYAREQADGTLDKAGIYVGYGQISSNVKGQLGGKAGSVDMDAYTVGGYWTHQAASGWYTDAVVQGTWYSADAKSVYGQQIKPDGFGLLASLEGGYTFKLGNGFTIEPQAQIAYQHVSFGNANDAYGFVRFDDGESLRARLGVRVTKSWNMADDANPRLVTAWLRANVWHEFMGKATTSWGSLNGQNMTPFNSYFGGTWGEIGAGVTAQVSDKVNLFATGSYNRSLDNKGNQGWDGRLGVNVKW